jgi:cell division protease FtsH
MQPTMDPVHRVSIVSRGLALGYTLIPPEKDRYQETRTELLEQAASLLGGRAAEEIIFDELTGGAASDIDKVTRLARKMVVDYGMSELGPIYLGPQIESSDWGKAYYQPTELSEKLKAQVDQEVKRIVDEAYQAALKILKQEKKRLDKIAKELVKQETLEGEEFEKLMGVKKARTPNNDANDATEPAQE